MGVKSGDPVGYSMKQLLSLNKIIVRMGVKCGDPAGYSMIQLLSQQNHR